MGADGVKSVIRNQICGEVPAVYTGDAVWRINVPSDLLPPDFQDPVIQFDNWKTCSQLLYQEWRNS